MNSQPAAAVQVSITTPSGEVKTQECLVGADIVVQVGDEVTKDEPLTTNPNVGGFGQEEKECVLQDFQRLKKTTWSNEVERGVFMHTDSL